MKADTEKGGLQSDCCSKRQFKLLPKAGSQKVGDAVAETAKDVKGNVEKRFLQYLTYPVEDEII